MLRRFWGIPVAAALVLVNAGLAGQGKHDRAKAAPTIAATQDGYVGSQACAACHAGIAKIYAKTSMGHSLSAITEESLQTLPLSSLEATSYFDPNSNHHFEVRADHGKVIETEYETAGDGSEVFRNSHPMSWVIGTGENGFGLLLKRGDFVFQAPLSYYTRAARWNLSPGYQNGDLSFNRLILPGCMYCHSGRSEPVAGQDGRYNKPVFTEESIGCENCHGPGAAHIAAMRAGKVAKGPDPTIVNPDRLSGQLADDICMSCHQAGDARVLQPGKTYQDFRPGQALEKTVAVFQIPPTPENPPQADHVEHYYSMSLSKCFRATRGLAPEKQLRCTSCHDPHVEPAKEEAPAYFKAKCLNCHTTASCTAPKASREATSPADNCIGCHMQQRDIRVISHSSATNHRIVKTPDEPFPDIAFHQTTAAMPDLIEINPAGERGANASAPPQLVRLQAYALLERGEPRFHASWLQSLSALENTLPENAVVQASLGHRDLADHRLSEAIDHLQRAIGLDPMETDAYVDLSEAQDQSGQTEAAITSAKRAADLNPYVAAIQKTLILRLINGKRYDEAQTTLERYLETFPEDDGMRRMLAMVKQ